MKALGAVVFDLDALADIESAGHRPAFNAAFKQLGLDIEWTAARYRQLQALCDERRRVAAELRKRGVSSECDVLAELLVDEVCAAKEMIIDETILDADIAPRTGLVDLITEAFGAGIAIGVVSSGRHSWVEPLVRQLVGEGIVSTIVTADDAPGGEPLPGRPGRSRGLRPRIHSRSWGVAGESTQGCRRRSGDGADRRRRHRRYALRVADCQRVHDKWLVTSRPSAA